MWDQGAYTFKQNNRTQQDTALAYAELHSGPEPEFEEKYPSLMTFVFVAMFYGFGQPMFFVLVLLCFIASYYTEKF